MSHHNGLVTAGLIVGASTTTASLLDKLPTIISVVAGILTIVFMAVEIVKDVAEFQERREARRLEKAQELLATAAALKNRNREEFSNEGAPRQD